MTIVDDSRSALKTDVAPSIGQPETAWRLVAVAVGWILLSAAPAAAIGFFKGFTVEFVRTFTKGETQLHISPTLDYLLISTLGGYFAAAVFLYAVFVRGRIVGNGDLRLGLGLTPIANLPFVFVLGAVLVIHAGLIDYTIYQNHTDPIDYPDILLRDRDFPL